MLVAGEKKRVVHVRHKSVKDRWGVDPACHRSVQKTVRELLMLVTGELKKERKVWELFLLVTGA